MTQVTIENEGNIPAGFVITPHPDDNLRIEPDQKRVKIGPGASETVDFQITPRRQSFIGEAKTETFHFR